MKSKKTTISALALGLMAATPAAYAEDSFYEAISGGKVNFDARLRYENVEQDNPADNANGLTLRTRLGYETADYYTLGVKVEMLDNRIVGGVNDFSSGDPSLPVKTGYSVIADPAITVLNQGYIQSKPIENMLLRGGRQRIILDNARFIGNVGWRQNEQTFDAFRFKYSIEGFTADLGYIGRVKGIEPKFNAKGDDYFANLAYDFGAGKITAYYYGLNQDSTATPSFAGGTFDNATSGFRLHGKPKVAGDWKIIYTLEYANQQVDSLNNVDTDFNADYYLGEFGFGWNAYSLYLGYEVLGSDGGDYGFQTPLATKHAFNGWADLFLVTPVDGLKDAYIKGVAKVAGFKFIAVYHQFNSDEGSVDYGNELDLLAVKTFAKKYSIGLKYANFSRGDFYDDKIVDTTKYWLWGEIKF